MSISGQIHVRISDMAAFLFFFSRRKKWRMKISQQICPGIKRGAIEASRIGRGKSISSPSLVQAR